MSRGSACGSRTLVYVLLTLALVLLSCAAKNYLLYFIQGTEACSYLCPSVLGGLGVSAGPLFDLFQFQYGIAEALQIQVDSYLFNDRLRLFSVVLSVPVIEELLYRGPLYLLKQYAKTLLWWLAAVVLVVIFVLSHNRSGLAMVPVAAVGLSACWLIMKTGRFWPCVLLHVLYNAYFFSITLYQVMLWGD